jgi:hypothetical protein
MSGYSNLTVEWKELCSHIGKPVRITYFRRQDGLKTSVGERSMFDIDIIMEGTLGFCPPTGACIKGFDGVYDFRFLRSMVYEPTIGVPSKFDGRINGSYIIQLLER